MITHTNDSHQIPRENKTKSKLQIKKKNCQKFKFRNYARNFTCTRHLLKLLDNMYKYEMDPTKTVGTSKWMRDGRTEWNQYTPPPTTTSLCRGYNDDPIHRCRYAAPSLNVLSHQSPVTHLCISKLDYLYLTSHYLNQYSIIFIRNICQWNFIWKWKVFIQENAFENLPQPQCVKTPLLEWPLDSPDPYTEETAPIPCLLVSLSCHQETSGALLSKWSWM